MPPKYTLLTGLSAQVVVEGPVSSMELRNLTSNTEYMVSVFPVYESGFGKSLQGWATTGRGVTSI